MSQLLETANKKYQHENSTLFCTPFSLAMTEHILADLKMKNFIEYY